MDIGKKLGKIVALGTIGLAISAGSSYAFDKSDVLNVSPRDYVESVGKTLKDYNLKGIVSYGNHCERNIADEATKIFPNAEVIVNFRYNPDDWRSCYGTVLIPKNLKKN
ncbi:MAG: hypothetical protein AABX93_03040 [Nanoarchaeota archaeon]